MYELKEHTAAQKVVFRAPDLSGLYASAVDMLRDTMVGGSAIQARRRVIVAPDGDGPGEQFFRFVRELVYLRDVDGFIPGVLVAMDSLMVAGEAFDPGRHAFEHVVKAVTRHQFSFAEGDGGLVATLVLDL